MGAPIWVIENATLMDDGILEGTIIDITDRKTAQQQVEYQAYHDSLTGLANRRSFEEVAALEIRRAHRYRRPLSLAYFDIDGFQAVNAAFVLDLIASLAPRGPRGFDPAVAARRPAAADA